MAPFTKFWLFALKDGITSTSQPFTQLLAEIVEFCASYTNPGPGSPQMHAFYKASNAPSDILLITGFPSQELNDEAHEVFVEKFFARMFELVEHRSMKQVEVDVKEFPLDQERLAVVTSGEKIAGLKGKGGWDVLQKAEDKPTAEEVWVHVLPWDEEVENSSVGAGEMLYLEKIVGR
jgi:hypothetical protein